MGRLSCSIILAAIAFSAPGCAAPEASKGLPIPLFSGGRDASLRKQVDADSFPTAKQAGVAATAKD